MARISWQTLLKPDSTEAGPRSSLRNAATVLRTAPQWRVERLWYDEFLDRVMIANSPVREWADRDDSRAALYMQEEVGMRTITSGLVREAVGVVAEERTRHCVRDWLTSLVWDKKERIAYAFEKYWGAVATETQPVDYLQSASANFLKGLVRRVFEPGCQLDHMVVFEGKTGIKKSSNLQVLGGDWYASSTSSVHSKDFFQDLRGKWLIEFQEMETILRADPSTVKSAITTRVDRYRPSYGRSARDFPRQCVFVGTTNKEDWGNDDTGLRRFWPIRCGAIDIQSLKLDREQLFAESVAKYRDGAAWWEMPKSANDVQADRQVQDVWTSEILQWINGRSDVTISDALTYAIKKEVEKRGRLDEMRIARILTLAGWKKHREIIDGIRISIWRLDSDAEVF